MGSVIIPIDPRVRWGVEIPASELVAGVNERCIELALGLEVLDLASTGLVLDAGCAMNGRPLAGETVASVWHLTQNISSEAIHKDPAVPSSYVSGDLRRMPMFTDHAFARTVCLSTLEHVGLDNSGYHGPVEQAPGTARKAVKELCRVTRDVILITVPFHETGLMCGRWRFVGDDEIGTWVQVLADHGLSVEMRFYHKVAGGWAGGGHFPEEASTEGFPCAVNAIVCLRGVR